MDCVDICVGDVRSRVVRTSHRADSLAAQFADHPARSQQLATLLRIGALFVPLLASLRFCATAHRPTRRAGLTPNVRNSADRVRHGHITKQGPRAVRWVLVEAAHTAKRRPPYARDFAAIARRRGKPIATVAIARKLLARCYWVLKEAS
jgi:transposase